MIYQFQRDLSSRLFAWSGFSFLAGLALAFSTKPFLRGFGLQAVGWAAIDALIAWFGLFSTRKQEAKIDAHEPIVLGERRSSLSRLLWINVVLDVFYILGGFVFARTKGREKVSFAGHGWGIVIQGAFLFLFDVFHALATSKPFPDEGN